MNCVCSLSSYARLKSTLSKVVGHPVVRHLADYVSPTASYARIFTSSVRCYCLKISIVIYWYEWMHIFLTNSLGSLSWFLVLIIWLHLLLLHEKVGLSRLIIEAWWMLHVLILWESLLIHLQWVYAILISDSDITIVVYRLEWIRLWRLLDHYVLRIFVLIGSLAINIILFSTHESLMWLCLLNCVSVVVGNSILLTRRWILCHCLKLLFTRSLLIWETIL